MSEEKKMQKPQPNQPGWMTPGLVVKCIGGAFFGAHTARANELWERCVIADLRGDNCFLTKAGIKYLQVEYEHARGPPLPEKLVPLEDCLSSIEPAQIDIRLMVLLLEAMDPDEELEKKRQFLTREFQHLLLTQEFLDEIAILPTNFTDTYEAKYNAFVVSCIRSGVLRIEQRGQSKAGAPGGPSM